jgi:hypothetical protein
LNEDDDPTKMMMHLPSTSSEDTDVIIAHLKECNRCHVISSWLVVNTMRIEQSSLLLSSLGSAMNTRFILFVFQSRFYPRLAISSTRMILRCGIDF